MTLVDSNMHPEELQDKEKVTNPLHSDEDTSVTLDDKITGTLLIK